MYKTKIKVYFLENILKIFFNNWQSFTDKIENPQNKCNQDAYNSFFNSYIVHSLKKS